MTLSEKTNLKHLAFVHDFKAMELEGKVYSNALNYKLFEERYLPFGYDLRIISRIETGTEEAVEKKYILQGPHVEIQPIRMYRTPLDLLFQYHSIYTEMEKKLDKIDFVFIRLPSILGNIAEMICRRKNIPFIVESVGCALESYWYYGNISGKIMAPFYYLLTRLNIQQAENVIYVSERFLQKRYPNTKHTLACADLVCQMPTEQTKNKRLLYKSKKELKLVTVAVIDIKYKGQQYVIKALRILKMQGIIAHYYLVGQGDSSYLKMVAARCKVEDQVHFIGALSHGAISDFLDRMDVYIQPSLTEGLGRAPLEAMARCLPVIGSNLGGIKEFVHPELLVPPHHPKEIAKKIKLLYNQDFMATQIEYSYAHIQKYDNAVLQKRRTDFIIASMRDTND